MTHDTVKVALVHVQEQLAGLLRVTDVLEGLGRVLACSDRAFRGRRASRTIGVERRDSAGRESKGERKSDDECRATTAKRSWQAGNGRTGLADDDLVAWQRKQKGQGRAQWSAP